MVRGPDSRALLDIRVLFGQLPCCFCFMFLLVLHFFSFVCVLGCHMLSPAKSCVRFVRRLGCMGYFPSAYVEALDGFESFDDEPVPETSLFPPEVRSLSRTYALTSTTVCVGCAPGGACAPKRT